LLLLVILVLILFFGAKLLPRLGNWAGSQSRKPFRQAKWMWSWFAGSEAESLQAERDYGRECAREFAKQFSGGASPAGQQLVAAVGSRLADAVKDRRREFHFQVAPSPILNAYALPGGFVFITDSLLNLCGHDRDETAFLLAHEMGHVLRGHAKDQMTASALLNAVSARLPAAGQMLRQIVGKGYSRELELEADREAVRLAAAAGFDPRAALGALRRLAQVSPGNSGLAEYLSTHPPWSERVRELERSMGR
jgi:beta-barrel assembly-enhancing protease